MSRPGLLEGTAVAAVASLGGAILHAALLPLCGALFALKILTAIASLGYVAYLLRRSPRRGGRLATLALWAVSALAIDALAPAVGWYVAGHLGLVWLVRAVHFQRSTPAGLADLGLVAFGYAAAVWAGLQTHSLLASLWCLMLVQAAFGCIPARLGHPAAARERDPDSDERFERAHRAAEAALARHVRSL
ncbi:MAG: hypothetical protein HY749_16660 [Gammaproteobacteria bacterium]|nr:hypothetical protein [Gammaproteobacteria bacterium]